MSSTVNWNSGDAERSIAEAMDEALSAGGEYMTGAVRAEIRSQDLIDTGFLINSIDQERVAEDTERIGTNAHYAVYLEYGTRSMSAKAFMRRAKDNATNQANIFKLAQAALRGAIQ